MPWKEDTPVPSVLVEVFAKIEVVLQDEKKTLDKAFSSILIRLSSASGRNIV
jgi:hypothetical protein